jgi:hypothetical protein
MRIEFSIHQIRTPANPRYWIFKIAKRANRFRLIVCACDGYHMLINVTSRAGTDCQKFIIVL